MRLRFDEAKATQAAALFLKLRGGRMSYMKLLKLVYLTDRKALLQWGRPVTMDHFVSMKHGPVPSEIYSLVVEDQPPTAHSVWSKYISAPLGDYEVSLLQEAPTDRLSRAEEKLVSEIFAEYGSWNRWDLVNHLHQILPEWKDPGPTSVPISIREILKTEFSSDDIRDIEADLNSTSSARESLESL
jgi:uncharacterized phage-associated protein